LALGELKITWALITMNHLRIHRTPVLSASWLTRHGIKRKSPLERSPRFIGRGVFYFIFPLEAFRIFLKVTIERIVL